MAVVWTNIENGESGLSVRNKINTFNNSLTTENENIETSISNIEDNITDLQNTIYKMGFADYNDAATSTTPISVSGGIGYVDLTNDANGTYTNIAYLPEGVSNLWDSVNDEFSFTTLNIGDMIEIRCNIEVTTTANNQDVELILELSGGTSPFNIHYTFENYKNIGTYHINKFNGFYIGNETTKLGSGKFKIKSDSNCTVKVNGWYCKITAK